MKYRPLFLLLVLLASLWGMMPLAQAAEINIATARIEAAEDGYKLLAHFDFELNHTLEDAVKHGVPLYFTTELDMTRPRWYWFDEKAVSASQTARLSYNLLTRQYSVTIPDVVQQSFGSLDDALFLLRRPVRWLIAAKGALKPGESYHTTLRMRLNFEYQLKPIQVDVINKSDWRLVSDKKTFTYKVEEK